MMFRPTLIAGAATIAAVVLGAGPALAGTAHAPLTAAAGSWSAPVPLPAGAGSGFAENSSGAQVAVTGPGPQVSTSANGQTWSAPVTIGQGGTAAAVALGSGGRAVAAWVGGTSAAHVVQAAVKPPGGTWSAPVTVGADGGAPLIGIDGSGDAIVAWKGSTGTTSTGPVYTASLPAGGNWTAVKTLTTSGGPIHMAVNAAGSVVVAWGAKAGAAWADSGTVLGGFGAPVMVGPSLYGHTLNSPVVALNAAGEAVLAWTNGGNAATAATRTASGTWSAPAALPCSYAFSTAIDGAGDAIVTCEEATLNPQGQWVESYYVSRLAAGGTWGTPVLFSSDFLTGGIYSAGDAAGTFVIAVNDSTAHAVVAFTSRPGRSFGPGTSFPASLSIGNLNIAPGRATLVWTTPSSGAFESTEPVS